MVKQGNDPFMTAQKKSHQENKINWDEMAGVFDRWLPYIQPVAEALVDRADISGDTSVLDVASGTGEPSLTLARRHRHQNVWITGVDDAEAMVRCANKKAGEEGLSRLCFQKMKAEDLHFPSASFDRIISRFGVMLFDDPLRGLEEMRRVLKAGGKMAIAVWGLFHKIPSLYMIWDVLMAAMPEERRPATPRIGKLGDPEKLAVLLETAGFEKIDINRLPVIYRFDNFESYWSINTDAGLLKEPLDYFSPVEQAIIKEKVAALTIPYEQDGSLVFQNQALIAVANK